jgi:RNA polymerase sporulation-specific sigma factor
MISLLLFANTLLFSLRLSGSGSFPKPLSATEEREWLSRYASGDPAARTVLIERNLRLVAHIIKKYYTQNADQEDLISIGTIGLIKGISSFDPTKGARLATYAARCIENEILMYFRAQKKLQGEVSLSDSIDSDQDGDSLQLMDVVGVDDTMLEDLYDRDSALRLRELIKTELTPQEAEIIRLRYGLGGTVPLTQREVASSFGISRSYVSRIEKHALETLRLAFERSSPRNQTARFPGISEGSCK